MKTLLWKLILIVPLGIGIASFLVNRLPWFQQANIDQTISSSATRSHSNQQKLATAAVLAIEPKPVSPAQKSVTTRPRVLNLMQELAVAKNYKPTLERLASVPQGDTADARYAKYVILSSCATLAGKQQASSRLLSASDRRQRFLSGLNENDPQKMLRLTAYEQLDGDHCAGLENIGASEAEIASLLDSAARDGDAKARAALVEKTMWANYRLAAKGDSLDGPGLPELSENQLESLKSAILSKDPEAMLIAGRVLSNSIDNLTLQIGTDRQNIDHNAFYNAWQLLGCDYGMDCGSSHAKVLSSCAYQGLCATSTLADNLYYYGNSPYQSQLLDQYRTALKQVIETGDWSQLRFTRGNNPPGTRYFIRGGP